MPALRLLLSMEGGVLGIIFTSFTTEVHQLYWRVKPRLTFKKGNVNSRLSGEMGSKSKNREIEKKYKNRRISFCKIILFC